MSEDGETLDYPFKEVVATAEAAVASGATVLQKFTCAGCGKRLTMDVPDVFYETGNCECGTVTDIAAQGCNYMLYRGDREALMGALSRLDA